MNVINFKFKVFETATVDTAITLCRKSKSRQDYDVGLLDVNSPEEFRKMPFSKIKKSFLDEKNFRTNLNSEKVLIYHKIRNDTIPLENICYIDAGIVVHSEKAEQKKADFIFRANPGGNYKKYCEGKNISKNCISNISKFIDYKPDLHHRGKFQELFENKKMLIKDIAGARKIVSALDLNDLYVDQTVRICTLLKDLEGVNNTQVSIYRKGKKQFLQRKFNLLYIQAILSSNLLSFYFSEFLSDGLHISPHQIRSLPIKNIPVRDQKPFISLVDKIIATTKDDDYLENPAKQAKVRKYESHIDQLVYKLYNLTPEEIEIVEESLK